MHKNLGVIIEKKPKDWVAGTLPFKVLNPSGDWTPYLPSGESQKLHHEDSMACVTFSCLNVIETQYKFFTGKEINFSDRFIAKLSGTQPIGNTIQNVLDAINKYGLVLEEEWPTSPNFDWAEYYADIPQSVKDKANKTIKVQYEFHSPPQDWVTQLKHVPFEMILEAGNPYHSVEMVNTTQQFDHYDPFLTPQKSIYLGTKILVKGINMSNAQFVKKAGTQEFGFYLPALSPDALKDKALNLGLDLGDPIDFTKAKDITGL
jgi:hypothetical protein